MILTNFPTEPVPKDATEATVSDGNNPGEYYSGKLHVSYQTKTFFRLGLALRGGVRGHVSVARTSQRCVACATTLQPSWCGLTISCPSQVHWPQRPKEAQGSSVAVSVWEDSGRRFSHKRSKGGPSQDDRTFSWMFSATNLVWNSFSVGDSQASLELFFLKANSRDIFLFLNQNNSKKKKQKKKNRRKRRKKPKQDYK